MLNKTTMTKSFRKVAKALIKNTQTNFYRPDLTKGACCLRAALRCSAGPAPVAWHLGRCCDADAPARLRVCSRAGQVEPDQQVAEEEARQEVERPLRRRGVVLRSCAHVELLVWRRRQTSGDEPNTIRGSFFRYLTC